MRRASRSDRNARAWVLRRVTTRTDTLRSSTISVAPSPLEARCRCGRAAPQSPPPVSMTEVAIVQTDLAGREAGEALGRQIRERLSGTPDALIVFAAPDTDHAALLEALAAATGTRTIVGCSTAGEFTSDGAGQGLTNVTAIRA